MATPTLTGSSHLGVTDNQKRWLVAGIALNKILIPRIRPFTEQGVNTEYSNLKTSHNIHAQSTSGRLQKWPPGKFLKYENINGNDVHPRLPGKRFNYSLFDCRVTSHVDFARLYVENHMAKFTAFDEHCDASSVLLLLGRVPAFNMAVQTAADVVRTVRNDWAHCVFSKWDQPKFLKSFSEMEQLVRSMTLPTADEAELLGELKDWESKESCMKKVMRISDIFPLLSRLAEVGLALPVSNAWPERGVSCLKRLKTRLRSRLSQKMLNSLMMISINGPRPFSKDADDVMKAAVQRWLSAKKRRRLPRSMMPKERQDVGSSVTGETNMTIEQEEETTGLPVVEEEEEEEEKEDRIEKEGEVEEDHEDEDKRVQEALRLFNVPMEERSDDGNKDDSDSSDSDYGSDFSDDDL